MFKKVLEKIGTVLLLLVTAQVYASGGKVTTITCNVPDFKGSGVVLYKLENGQAQKVRAKLPEKQDTIQFSYTLEKEGAFFIQKVGKGGMFSHVIYLKPGDNKLVDISNHSGADFDLKVVKPNTETVYLQNWVSRLNNIEKLGTNRSKRDEFIIAYNNLVKEAELLKKNSRTGNKYFNYVFTSKVDADILYLKAAAFFHFGSRLNAGYDSSENHRQFYQSLTGQKFCNASILHSEHGLELVKFCMGYNLTQKYGSVNQMLAASFVEKAKSICSDSIRLAYVLIQMPNVNSYEQFKTEIQPFEPLFATSELQAVYQQKLN